MKKNVMVIRESIERVVALLTKRKIRVTQRGANACVRYAPDGSIVEVNLPYIPDTASDEFVAAVQGFLDHEVGHVLFTDPKVPLAAAKQGQRIAGMQNIVEDTFVERKMAEAFQGSGANLDEVRKFYLTKLADPAVKTAMAKGDLNAAVGSLIVVQVRAWGGQVACRDYLASNPDFDALLKPFRETVGELADQIPMVESSADGLILATRIVRRMEEAEKKRREKEAAERAAKASEGADKAEKSKEKPEKPESKRPEKEDEPDPDGEDSDDGEEAPEPDDKDDAGDPEDKSEPESDDSEDEPEPEGGDEDKDKGEPESEPERDEDADDDRDPEKDADDKPEPTDKDEPTDEADLGDTDGGAKEGRGDDEDREGEEEVTGESTSSIDHEDTTDESPEDALDAALDSLADDFDEELSRKLAESAVKEIAKAPYRVFSREWDKAEPAPTCDDASAIAAMDESVRAMTGVVSKHLERAMAAQSRVGFNPGMRSGRINQPSLYKVGVGDDRVFRHKYERHSKRTAVSLLIDCSGSMSGGRIRTAALAAYALSSALERLRIDHEVIGFTTKSYHGPETAAMRDAMEAERKRLGTVPSYGRSLPIYMPIFKGFHERLNAETKSRLANLTHRPDFLSENPDGECVQLAGHRLASHEGVERRILIVLSDGYPACPPGNGLNPHLREVVKGLSKSMHVVGIGIQSDAVKSFYPKSLVLNDVSDLPVTVVKELARLLLEQ